MLAGLVLVGAVVPPLDILANQAPRRFDGKLGPTLFGAVANWAPGAANWAIRKSGPGKLGPWIWTGKIGAPYFASKSFAPKVIITVIQQK